MGEADLSRFHTHLAQGLGDGVDHGAHVLLEEAADVADSEGVGLANLARIQQKALLGHEPVELGPNEGRILRVHKAGDDVALHRRRQVGLQTDGPHGRNEGGVVGLIPRGTGGDAAFLFEFFERLGECQNTCLLYTSPSPRD